MKEECPAVKKRRTSALLGLFLLSGLLGYSFQEKGQGQPVPAHPYAVRLEKSVMVPMRDGVKLSTDLYFPVGPEGRLPVIVMRTPYDKNFYREKSNDTRMFPYFFVEHGYVVIIQDCRGKYESEGAYVVSAADSRDGDDTVTWTALQPWSNGRVGTYGCSYSGENQIEMAKLRNPHLKAMIPRAAGGAVGTAGQRYTYFGAFKGGVFEISANFGWFFQYGSKIYYRPPADTPHAVFLESAKLFNPAPQLPPINYREIWKTLPVINMMKNAGGPPTDFEDFLSHEPADPWWDRLGYIEETDQFDVPALHVNSWYDFGVGETLYTFDLFQRNAASALAKENQFVIISPTAHCLSEEATQKTIVGERELGDARLDYENVYLRWFDYWLRGIDNGITKMPKVQVFVMGAGAWRSGNEWPPAGIQLQTYYFHSDGRANGRYGTGRLGPDAPGAERADTYVYDPKTPVPSRGGPVCCTGSPDAPEGSYDQSEVEMRQDVLVYTTTPLTEGVEVTGPLEVVLYVSSSAPDTDFTAKLVDVYPDGRAYNVQEGIQRARYREGFDRKVWFKPGEAAKVRIDLQATSNYFGPGHRIRLEISSSNFPRFERNLNTGGNNYDEAEGPIARNTIYHSARYPSAIILPIFKKPMGVIRPGIGTESKGSAGRLR